MMQNNSPYDARHTFSMSSLFLSLYLSIYLKRYVALFQPTTCLLLVYLGHWVIGGLRHFCLVVENNNHFPHSYFQAVLCDQKASPANCRAASIKVSQFSDNIIFLGHCFSLKEVWDNKYTYASELLIVLRVAGSWSLSQHAVRQDEGVLYTLDRSTSLSHGYTHKHASFNFYWLEDLMETTTQTVLCFLQFKSQGHMNKPPVCPTGWEFICDGFRLREGWGRETANRIESQMKIIITSSSWSISRKASERKKQ